MSNLSADRQAPNIEVKKLFTSIQLHYSLFDVRCWILFFIKVCVLQNADPHLSLRLSSLVPSTRDRQSIIPTAPALSLS